MKIRHGTLDEILAVHQQITDMFPITDVDHFSSRVGAKTSISLVAEIGGELVGYKLGYWLDDKRFYSWLGGVIPGHRRQGLAKAMLKQQEREVLSAGGEEIVVKSMNQYPNMMIMLLANGYQVQGYERLNPGSGKIEFGKRLV